MISHFLLSIAVLANGFLLNGVDLAKMRSILLAVWRKPPGFSRGFSKRHRTARAVPLLKSTPLVFLLLASYRTAVADDWPLPRGDEASTGATATQLADDLVVVWEFKADEAIESTPVVVADTVFIADATGMLYAIDAKLGKERWRLATDLGFNTSPAVQNGLLVIGDLDGKVYGVNAATGELRWTAETKAEVNGSASFYENKTLVTSQDGSLYALSLTGIRSFGAIAPLGGLCLLSAWLLLAVSSFRSR